MERGKHHVNAVDYKGANLFSKFMLNWMNDIFRLGYSRPLKIDDLFNVCDIDDSNVLHPPIEKKWKKEQNRKKPSLKKVILYIFYGKIISLSLLRIITTALKISLPFQMLPIMQYTGTDTSPVGVSEVYIRATVLCACVLLITGLDNPMYFGLQKMGMRIRVSLSSMIYSKVLKLSQISLEKVSNGHVINLLSSDIDRFNFNFIFFPSLFICPMETLALVIILYFYIGFTSLSGFILCLFMVPFQIWISGYFKYFKNKMAQKTDERIGLMSEVLAGMRAIKMYCWESYFIKIINQVRRNELSRLIHFVYLRSGAINAPYLSLSKTMPFVSIICLVYASGTPITTEVVFILLSVYGLIRNSMCCWFADAVPMCSEMLMSLHRIQDFLLLEEYTSSRIEYFNSFKELSAKELQNEGTPQHDNDAHIILERVSTMHKQLKGKVPVLENINVSIAQGDLVTVIGTVGSGKTSLLLAILGELPLTRESRMHMQCSTSYAAQEPWVFSSSIRQNITFGRKFDAKTYDEVLKAVCLDEDLIQLPDGDNTLVGERGVTLSGGQRSRLGLARALYSDADAILMDDPLSAVDVRVGNHIFNKCIKGLLKNKTRILVTHQLKYINKSDKIIVINEGYVKCYNSFNALIENEKDLSTIIYEKEEKKEVDSTEDTDASPTAITSQLHVKEQDIDVDFEDNEEGSIDWSIYYEYIMVGYGKASIAVIIFVLVILNTSTIFADWWLINWSNLVERKYDYIEDIIKNKTETVSPQTFSLHIYISIYWANIIILFIFACLNSTILYIIMLKSSKVIHTKMLNSIFRSPMRFFDINPIGRILNRFSKDIYQADELLSYTLYEFLTLGSAALSIVIFTSIINYYVILPLIPLLCLFMYIRNYYLATSRSIIRLEAATRSPVFTHVSSSIVGLHTIRAFDLQDIFQDEFNKHINQHTEAWHLFIGGTRWLAVRLDLLCVLFNAVAIFFNLLAINRISPAMLGFILYNTLILLGSFQWSVKRSGDIENMMTSIQRLLEYYNLKPEAPLDLEYDDDISEKWPSKGDIVADSVSLKYHEDGEDILKNISFEIRSQEKIGIVGRTGAGKSSLISMLFRMTEFRGQIKIDGVDIKQLGLRKLRGNISIIPQDPILFGGTIRENLDPFNIYTDSDIWKSLKEVQLCKLLISIKGELTAEISQGGTNFSVGERQLFCLARALLNRNKILVIDEATANVDIRTDELIQETIRKNFSDCTILTIAHRLNTIMDSDRIMVLDKGEIIEFDEPYELLQNSEGYFTKLVDRCGPMESKRLFNITKEIHNNKHTDVIQSKKLN